MTIWIKKYTMKKEFKLCRNKKGLVTHIETHLTGQQLLGLGKLNKGCAFTDQERQRFELMGKLPPRVLSLQEQVEQCYRQYQAFSEPLQKNIYLNHVFEINETLFFALVSRYLAEMLPIVYTPTIGLAVENFSGQYRDSRGLFISYADKDNMDAILSNRFNQDIDMIVVTDGEAILGIGDQGVGGMQICVGKLALYTLCANLNPHRVLPIQLDLGTNNQSLLDDIDYLGWRHPRIEGEQYHEFIACFVVAIKRHFPQVYLHWEDIGVKNARRILENYRHELCTFNDDMQGTGVVALAAILAALPTTGMTLTEHKIVILGPGTSGLGIADQVYRELMAQGLSDTEARQRIWLVGRHGLLIDNMTHLTPERHFYARKQQEISQWTVTENVDLATVVAQVKPSILIGCSTVAGAFKQSMVEQMAKQHQHPIIMPLSNPTPRAEASPKNLLQWTQGKALIATGSPFAPVNYQGRAISIAQSNNALVYPGIGLAAVAVKARYVSDEMLSAAAHALAAVAPILNDSHAPLLPDLADIKQISKTIAIAVANKAREQGIAQIADDVDLDYALNSCCWKAQYYPLKMVA